MGDEIHRLRERARTLAVVGEHLDVEELRTLLRAADATGDLDAYAFASYELYWASGDGPARERLRRAGLMDPHASGWSARARAAEEMLAQRHEESAHWNRVAIELARAADDALLEALALEQLGIVESLLGRLDQALERLYEARACAGANGLHAWFVNTGSMLCDVLAEEGRLQDAIEIAESSSRYARHNGLESMVSFCDAAWALALATGGEVGLARDIALGAVEVIGDRAGDGHDACAALMAAHVLLEAGDRAHAPRVVELARRRAEEFGYRPFLHEAAFAVARLAELRSDDDAAVAGVLALDPDETVERVQVALWLARAGARLGDDALVDAAREHLVRADQESRLVALARVEVDAIATRRAGGAIDPAAICEGWRAAGRLLDAARCRLVLALLEEPASRAAAMRAAMGELQRRGARRDAEVAAVALRTLGARVAIRSAGVDEVLTPRQLDVAVLVGDGLTTGDMARALGVSVETVRYHLKGAFTAAGVGSRLELATWLRSRGAG